MPTHLTSACRAATAVAVAVVAVLGVGCHPNPPAAADPAQVVDDRTATPAAGRSPAAHAAAGLHPYAGADRPDDPTSLGAPPASVERAGPSSSDVDGAADPEVVAARLIADRLAAEGLQTVWLDTRLLEGTALAATVAVQVAHGPGYGHPTQTVYQLNLTAGPTGWQLHRIHESG